MDFYIKWAAVVYTQTVSGIATKERLVVLDFDGTLYFTSESARAAAKELYGITKISSHRYNSLPTKAKVAVDYLGYSKYASLSTLNAALVNYLGKSQAKTDFVVITGRDSKLRTPTLALTEKSGLMVKRAFFAPNMARHAMTWRLKTIKGLARGYKSVEIYDDRKDHLDYIAKNITHCNKYQFYMVQGKRIMANGKNAEESVI